MSTTQPQPPVRLRDVERSRGAILDAAEVVFAERGFHAATLREIGERAQLSRATPAFHFGSKDRLYAEVIKRVFAERHALLAPALELARTTGAAMVLSRDERKAALEATVGAYIDFLASRPTFVRLMQWEALTGAERLRSIPHESRALEQVLDSVARGLPKGDGPHEATQLVLSFVALCITPFEHASTLMPALGVSPTDPRFLRGRKRHVVRLLAHYLAQDAE